MRRGGIARAAARGLRPVAVAALLCSAAAPALPLETDQYFAWTRPIADAADAINAKMSLELQAAVREANARRRPAECHDVRRLLQRRLRFFIFQPIQIWTDHAPFVDRVPATAEEEFAYRRESLYPYRGLVDLGVSIPPSPTIEVDGIRLGTDKLAHFFSNGWRYHARYRRAVRRGASEEDALATVERTGAMMEKTLLGFYLSGVFSLADMEANRRGFEFYRALCDGEAPAFVNDGGAWRVARPFDIRKHVSPEWDESWRASIYTRFRWRRVEPRMAARCSELGHPLVAERRAAYARRDVETPTDRLVARLVRDGRLPDPERFTIDAVCRARAEQE